MRARKRAALLGLGLLLGACGSTEPAQQTPDEAPAPIVYPEPGDGAAAFTLAQAGFFAARGAPEPAAELRLFKPGHELWTDAASKRRWVQLPPGARIDSSDMDHWQLPVGARLFKEFSRDGRRLETRLIARTGPGDRDYWMGAFVWNDEGSEAVFAAEGAENVLGTSHDVPSAKRCWTCHNGEPGRALGFSAVQLADGDGPLPLQALSAEGLLTHPPAATELGPPGDETSRAALGYLHANCGHCHNPGGSARPDTDMVLRLDPAERDVAQTSLYRSNVGVALQNFSGGELSRRIVPGRPEQSGLVFRMHQRGTRAQMPPFGTEEVDPSGLRLVGDWIAQLE